MSTVTIDVPTQPNAFPTYHTSQIKLFNINDKEKFPSRSLPKPGPIIVDGVEEYCTILFNSDRGVTCDPCVQIFGFGHLPKLVWPDVIWKKNGP